MPIFENLLEFYRKSDGATKKEIPGCIFAEKLLEWLRAQCAELRVSITFLGFKTSRLHDRKTKKASVEHSFATSSAKASKGIRKVATPVFTEPVQLIFRISEVLASSKKNTKRSILTSCAVW